MTVLSRQKFSAVVFLAATFVGMPPAMADGNSKSMPSSYWRGGYFGPEFSLTMLKNTYNPTVPIGVRKLKANGKIIGMVGGYNFLRKGFMWGVEGSVANGSVFTDDLSYIATLRGRIGKPINYSLPYVIAGPALAGLKKSPAGAPYKSSSTQVGLVVGIGFEQVLANAISGRLEYTYARFFTNGRSGGARVRLKNLNMFRASVVVHLRD
ncbi:hypothetical protein MNBD_ALPHA08-109 [hydrothermal vent metagenome]|uniref:Outer membrane protein beta-barrel domain-containing protein n=1 Tax=hydrothermal vent metagenome TaxID=652676 RepID=A0A3B0RNZ3_9ZZZZ